MAIKRAEEIRIFLCEHCASVHIGLFRGGKLFAEAIPNDPEEVLGEMRLAVVESKVRQASPSAGCH